MKNLKSILKKLTLILLASFLLAGSQNLLAMASDSESEAVSIGSSNTFSDLDIASVREVESEYEYESECLDCESDYKKIHEGKFISSVKTIQQSGDGKFIFVLLENELFKILRRNDDTGEYFCIKTYASVYSYEISSDGDTVCVEYDYNGDTGTYSLKILKRWDSTRFVENKDRHENVYRYKISEDGNVVCIGYDQKRCTSTYTLKILRWFGCFFLKYHVTYKDVWIFEISKDSNVVRVEKVCVKNDGGREIREHSLKMVMLNKEQCKFTTSDTSFDVENDEVFEGGNVDDCGISLDGKTVCVKYIADDDSCDSDDEHDSKHSLKIFRWNGSKFVEGKEYKHILRYEISSDGETVCIAHRSDFPYREFSLTILRWNAEESQFIESETYDNVRDYHMFKDGNMVCVKFRFGLLKIFRWNTNRFVESGIYDNVCGYGMSKDFRQICIGFRDFTFKILRRYSPEDLDS